MQVKEIILQVTQLLQAKKISHPVIEATSIIAYGLGITKTELYINYNKEISDSPANSIIKLAHRRAKYEPLEYIIKKVNFMGIEFSIEAPIFIPRPETEVLVSFLIEIAKYKKRITIFDICTGCGAIGIAILRFLPNAIVYASDIIDLKIAKVNAVRNKVKDRISFIKGDLFTPFKETKVDFIISNPPYIPTSKIPTLQPEIRLFESHASIDGGKDGLFFIYKLIEESPKYLKLGGTLLVELSPEQKTKVKNKALKYFSSVNFVKDFHNKDRVLVAKIT
jgi:release factor glutamine methyltransferase